MPHQRKYVPSHSGGTESQPSRAKRSISAWASHGFSSRLSRSTRCAFDSFTASLIGPSRTQKAGGWARFSARPPGRYPLASSSPGRGLRHPRTSHGYTNPRFTSRVLGSRAAWLEGGHSFARVGKYPLSIEIVKRKLWAGDRGRPLPGAPVVITFASLDQEA